MPRQSSENRFLDQANEEENCIDCAFWKNGACEINSDIFPLIKYPENFSCDCFEYPLFDFPEE